MAETSEGDFGIEYFPFAISSFVNLGSELVPVSASLDSKDSKWNKKRMRKRKRRRESDQDDGGGGEGIADGGGIDAESGEGDGLGGDYRRDPLSVFGSDIMMKIFGYLDARSVALSLLVSRAWFAVASSDHLWAPMCDELWRGKAHIPRWLNIPGLPKLATYSRAVADSKRVRIQREDLCDHAWDYHFTMGAPEYWKNLDPYWKGTGPPMRRYFHPDGSQSADPGDKVWGGHECCYTVVTSIYDDGKIREHYVRINRWPGLYVSRRKDWGWEMSSFLCAYSSIPDAHKEGGTGPAF